MKAALKLAFVAASATKLTGAEMMVATFEAVGLRHWFRYVTGAIEVAAAVLLWVPMLQLIGAVLMHVFILGPALFQLLFWACFRRISPLSTKISLWLEWRRFDGSLTPFISDGRARIQTCPAFAALPSLFQTTTPSP